MKIKMLKVKTVGVHSVVIRYLFHLCFYRALVHAIESVVIEWSHQIREVLKKDSSQPLLEGLNPNPYVEMEFWKVKAQNLECIYEQVNLLRVACNCCKTF